jgi:hypothetical protein
MDNAQNKINTSDEQLVENVPVHTMAQDLAEIANPSLEKSKSVEIEDIYKRRPVNQGTLTAAQKSSPFLNPAPAPQPTQDITPFAPKEPAFTDQNKPKPAETAATSAVD